MRTVLRRLIACVGMSWLAVAAAVLLGEVLRPVLLPLGVLLAALAGVELVRSVVAHDTGS